MNLVVDCSFIMSSILPDETTPFKEYYLYKLHTPSLFYLECSNVLLTALKRGRIPKNQYLEYLDALGNLPINIDNFTCTTKSLHSISKITIACKLSSYDASYLELALRLNAKMASFDKAVIEACKLNNIDIICNSRTD